MKNSHIRKFWLSLLLLIITLFVYLVYQINQDITNKSKWLDEVYKLKFINKNIDTIIARNTGFYNYDESKKLIIDLHKLLDEIASNNTIDDFYTDTSHSNLHVNLYKEIQEGFQTKEHFINVFTSANSILNYSTRFLTKLLLEMPEENYKNALIKLHSKVVQIGVRADSSLTEIEELNNYFLQQLKEKDSFNMALYTKHIKIIIDKFRRLTELKNENQALNFDKTLSLFIEHLQIHINKQISMLNNFMYFIVALILAIVVFLILLLNKKIQQEAKLKTFKQAVENSDNFIIITDKKHKIKYVNESFLKASGYEIDEILGKTPAIFKSGLLSQKFYDKLSSTIENGQKWSGEFINKNKNENLYYEKATITPIFNEDGVITNFLAIKLDITTDKKQQKLILEKNKEIEQRFYTDYLTNLGNRNLLMKKLSENEKGRLFHININEFSQLKTFYGMQNTDKILVDFSKQLQRFINVHIEEQSFLFRVKYDEFCLWCSEDIKSPLDTMKKIHSFLTEQEFRMNSTLIKLDVTIGASKNIDPKNQNRYLEAEIAHHNARSKSLNYMIYEHDNVIENKYNKNMKTIKLIQEAIEDDRLTIYFQPIFNVKNKKVHMYEALVRIIDKNGEVLLPQSFLEASKATNYYHKIMQIVIKKTFEKSNANLEDKFSINFSNIDFTNEITQKVLINELINAKKAENISIEILESENILDYTFLKETIDKIKKFGCKVCIDDFGSGHSNYYRLSQLDVDYIKIDGSIIKDLDKDAYSVSVIETIITFAKKMNYPLVVEYVHSKKIFDIIQKYDIEYAQGFYLGKPKDILLDDLEEKK